MFWGLALDAGKQYSQIVEETFHLSMAALENSIPDSDGYVKLMLQQDESEFLLCTLQHGKHLQQPLNIVFAQGQSISFSLNGSGTVHLTGYLMGDDEAIEEDPDWDETTYEQEEVSEEESDDDEEESDDEEIPDLVLQGKRKANIPLKKSKKIKLLNDDGEVVDDSDDDEEDYSDEEDEDSDEEDEDSDEEEEEDFSDDFGDTSFFDEEASEDEMETSVEKTPKSEKKNKKMNGTGTTPKQVSPKQKESPKNAKEKTPKQTQKNQKENGKTPQVTDKTPKKTPKDIVKKENGETPKSNKKAKKAATPKVEQSTPKVEQATPKSEVSDNQSTPATNGEKKKKKKKNKNNSNADSSMNESKADTPKSTPKKRVVAGGTVVEDLKEGHGPVAKAGKTVGVYYKGILQKNNKQFDSCLQGKPFKFRLSQNEVIKGWDTGVDGMKVGGKRKITVPANQGYGNRANGPIPANSVLVFEVELKSVS